MRNDHHSVKKKRQFWWRHHKGRLRCPLWIVLNDIITTWLNKEGRIPSYYYPTKSVSAKDEESWHIGNDSFLKLDMNCQGSSKALIDGLVACQKWQDQGEAFSWVRQVTFWQGKFMHLVVLVHLTVLGHSFQHHPSACHAKIDIPKTQFHKYES